jgi:phosphate starvation-inducible PhoH-like protein
LPRGARSGLKEVRTLLADVQGICFCSFTDADVVRHALVQKIILAYERLDEQRAAERAQRKGSESSNSSAPPRASDSGER